MSRASRAKESFLTEQDKINVGGVDITKDFLFASNPLKGTGDVGADYIAFNPNDPSQKVAIGRGSDYQSISEYLTLGGRAGEVQANQLAQYFPDFSVSQRSMADRQASVRNVFGQPVAPASAQLSQAQNIYETTTKPTPASGVGAFSPERVAQQEAAAIAAPAPASGMTAQQRRDAGTTSGSKVLPDGRRVLVGSQADPDSPNFVPTPPPLKENAYTVSGGDTLSKIAQSNNISLSRLLELNPQFRSNPDLIYPGQKVTLPPSVAGPQDQAPTKTDQQVINDYLNSIAQGDTSGDVKTRGVTTTTPRDTVAEKIAPGIEAPSAPDLSAVFATQKQAMGITDLEDSLNTANEDLKAFENDIISQANKIKGEKVSSVVINRRLVKVDADTRDAYNDLIAARNNLTNRLDMKYKSLGMVMDLTQQDFQNSTTVFNGAYDRALNAYKLLSNEQDATKTEAKSNLQAMQEVLKGANLSFADLSADQRASIEKMELQAGLPSGLTEFALQAVGEGDIITTGSRTGTDGIQYFDILYKNPDGSLETKVVARGATSSGAGATVTPSEQREIDRLGLKGKFTPEFSAKLIQALSSKEILEFTQDYEAQRPKTSNQSFLFTYNPSTGQIRDDAAPQDASLPSPDSYLSEWVKMKNETDDILAGWLAGQS